MHRRGRMVLCVCAGVLCTFSSGALGGTDERFAWSNVAPKANAANESPAERSANPLASGEEDERTETAAQDEEAFSRVGLRIGSFGVISAPDGLGSVEHAIGELALRRSPGSRVMRESSIPMGVAELKFAEGTPEEIKRITRALLEGADEAHADAYRAWAAGLSADDLSRAVDHLSTLVDPRSEASERDQRTALADEDEANLRTALAHLRELETMVGDESGRDGASSAGEDKALLGPSRSQSESERLRDEATIRRALELVGVIRGPGE